MMDSQDYQNLREEIMYSRKAQDKFTIFMYTSVATIIGFAIQFQNAYLFFLFLIITFPFSIKIADYRRTIANLAAYMIVFLENNDKCHWETDNYNIENDFGCKPKVKVSRNRFEVFIHSLNNYDSLIISLFCTAVFFYYKFMCTSGSCVDWKDICFLIIAIIVCGIILLVSILYSRYQHLKTKRIEKWKIYKKNLSKNTSKKK